MTFKPRVTISPPHQPKFEHIHFTSTLYTFVSCVVGCIIELVGLKEVRSPSGMAALEKALKHRLISIIRYSGNIFGVT